GMPFVTSHLGALTSGDTPPGPDSGNSFHTRIATRRSDSPSLDTDTFCGMVSSALASSARRFLTLDTTTPGGSATWTSQPPATAVGGVIRARPASAALDTDDGRKIGRAHV